MKQERLFAALGGVDPALIQRSEQTRKRRAWPMAVAALAACAVLLAAVWLPQLKQLELPQETSKTLPSQTLSFTGGDGALRLHSIDYGPDRLSIGFAIYVNEELYETSEEDGVYTIRPRSALPEDFPPIDLTITHLENCSKVQAMEDVSKTLAETYAQVSEVQTAADTLRCAAGDGTAWDAAQAEVLCVDTWYGGCFVLTARYFTEAAEGHGVRFQDMMNTFAVVYDYQNAGISPSWVWELQAATDQLMKAIFADRLEDVSDLLAENVMVDGYGEDVSGDISVAAIDYAPDNDQAPTSAVVSVKHRTSTEEGYDYLTMELTYTGERWLLTWAGIEK